MNLLFRGLVAAACSIVVASARAADPAAVPPAVSVIAVFEVRDPSHVVSAIDRKSLSRYLATKLAETGRFHVVPEADVRRVLEEKKLESYDACYDEACQIEIGKELAAQKSVAVEIVHLGETCALTALVFDLSKAASERAATEKGSCGIETLVVLIERIAVKLASDASNVPVDPATQVAINPATQLPYGVLRKSTKALSAMRFQFETRDTEHTFGVELLGTDGHRHTCTPPVKVGAHCTIEQVAIGEARLLVTSEGLLDHDGDLEIRPKNLVAIVRLDKRPSELAIVTWSFGGLAMAAGAALIPVGVGLDDRSFIYGGVPSLLGGAVLLIVGFLLDDRVSVEEVVID